MMRLDRLLRGRNPAPQTSYHKQHCSPPMGPASHAAIVHLRPAGQMLQNKAVRLRKVKDRWNLRRRPGIRRPSTRSPRAACAWLTSNFGFVVCVPAAPQPSPIATPGRNARQHIVTFIAEFSPDCT